MAQRIGASRATVTRLLSELRKKDLIRLEGTTLVIKNRPRVRSAGGVKNCSGLTLAAGASSPAAFF